jgi:hypothetical protein
MKQLLSMTTVLALLALLGYAPVDRHPFTICFRQTVGGRPLELFTGVYIDPFGERFLVEQFKYYISGIRVTDQQGKQELLASGSYLIDQADTGGLRLRLLCGLNRVRSIAFVVGVDSTAKVGGVMTGDLDPMRGMFWTWNSGYIYARLEGESDSANAPAHRFTWDVGGYKPNVNAAREVVLSVPDGRADNEPLVIEADLLKWFDGWTPIRLGQSPTCHEPGDLAMRLADNYVTMFSVVH